VFGKENYIVVKKASMLMCVDTGFFAACVYSPFLSHFSPKRKRDGLLSKRIRVTFLTPLKIPPAPVSRGIVDYQEPEVLS
jgi:hypothetical protein